ncbi:MAG: DUF1759 domain-containing protein [Gammaproteobacteria bacterium]|nr:DUF1759 domain-containing protein [Gammaproteobacteria bacterium]
MSGALRQVIGPTRSRLAKLLESADEEMSIVSLYDSGLSQSENLQHLNRKKYHLQTLIARIEAAVSILDTKNNEWGQLLSQLDGDRLSAEEKILKQFMDDSDGFIIVMLNGRDALAQLQVRLSEVDHTIGNVAELESHTSHRSSQDSAAPSASPQQDDSTSQAEQEFVPPAIPPPSQGASSQHIFIPITGDSPPRAPVQVGNLRLPKLELPLFYGDPKTFRAFWDIYESAVHSQNIADVQKFAYLSGQLRGKAREAINGIDITNDNYPQAIDILKRQFGSTRIIIQALFSELDILQKGSNRVSDLRDTLNHIEKVLRQLSSLGEDLNQSSLIRVVLRKFPAEIIAKLEDIRDSDTNWTMPELRRHLWDLITKKERVQDLAGSTSHHSSERGSKPQTRGSPQAIGHVFAVTNSQGEKSNTRPRSNCVFCDEPHFHKDCDKFKTASSRKAKLVSLVQKRCFVCFWHINYPNPCPNMHNHRPCRTCSSNRHNQASYGIWG